MANNGRLYMELGNTGLDRAAGYVYEEQLPQLQGLRGIRIYREMRDNDPVVGSILFAIEMLIRQVLWQVQPASDSEKDAEVAEFLDSCMNDMNQPWSELICEILSMLVFGWSYHEIVYKRRLGPTADPKTHSRFNDGRIGWRKIPIRAQETLNDWEFDEAGDIVAMWQMGPPNYDLVRIPMEKALLFRTVTRKGNPEGRSVLRNAYRPWYYKKNIESIEGIGIERDLAGLPVAWVPAELLDSNASAGDKAVLAEIKKIVRNIRRDEQEGIVFPLTYDENNNKIYDLTLLTTGGRRQFDTDTIVQRYDSRIAMTVLADFILLGTKNVGSFALSSSKTELFAVAIGAWLNNIADVFNRYAVPRLFELNSFGVESLPQIIPGDIESIPLEEISKYLSDLSSAGMPLFPNEDLEKYLLKLANLPINK